MHEHQSPASTRFRIEVSRPDLEEVAEKIGTGRRAVMDAEKGKPSTGTGVYAALLWAYDLLEPLEDLASPVKDKQGLTLAAAKEKKRARKSAGLENEF